MKKIVLFILLLTLCINVKAECGDDIISANNVFAYIDTPYENGEFNVYVNIENISENIYIVVTNNYNNNKLVYKYSDTDNGMVKIHTDNIYEKITYTIKVYTTNNECSKEYINKLEVETSAYNIYSGLDVCNNNYEIDECSTFYDSSKLTEEEFVNKVNKIIESESRTLSEKIIDYVKEYYLYVLIPLVLVIIYYIVSVKVYKKGRKKYEL